MPIAPITVRPPRYRGSDARRLAKLQERARDARRLEEYINARVAADGRVMFVYANLARELNLDKDTVCNLLGGAGGGNTGITVWGKDYKPRSV